MQARSPRSLEVALKAYWEVINNRTTILSESSTKPDNDQPGRSLYMKPNTSGFFVEITGRQVEHFEVLNTALDYYNTGLLNRL